MLTPASELALANLRDTSHLTWVVIPLFAVVIYVYANEIERKNWNLVLAGLAFWGMDWLNEIGNSVILHATGRSALWTAPSDSMFLIMVGLNIEICFMFAMAGITFAKMLPEDKNMKILGLNNRWFFGLTNSIFCVGIEIFLNHADMLIWEYPFWSFPHVWLIVPFGYLHFNMVAFWVFDMEDRRRQLTVIGVIYGLILAGIVVFGFGMGWL